MERVSDEWLNDNIMALEAISKADMRGPYEQFLALVELRELRSENKAMIDLAGEAIGTDPSLRSSACVEVLVNHVETLRKELRELRAAEKEPKPEPYDAEWTTLICPKCSHTSVCLDKFGYRCVIYGCGWTKNEPIIPDAAAGRENH